MAKATLSPVQFHGSPIFVVTHKGEPYAPIKPIVEDMGLDWRTQQRKITSNKNRWGMVIMTTPSASGNQDTLCMPVRKLPAFFASINPNKVRPELRDRIRLYQDECDDALWNYWTKGQATRKPKAALPAPAQLNLPAAEPLFDEAPLLELAEDIRRAQQTYRRNYQLFFSRLHQLGTPVLAQLEQRAALGQGTAPFSDMTIRGQFDRFLSERLLESLSSLAELLPDRHNPAMLLLACARAMNAR